MATSSQGDTTVTARLAALVRSAPSHNLTSYYEPMPTEMHATIYQPAALRGFRVVLKPQPMQPAK